MATNSSIEWTEATWNPVTGCDKVSPGCAHCYAERMAKRLQAMGHAELQRTGSTLTLQPSDARGTAAVAAARKRIFVNSMSDLFHAERARFDYIQRSIRRHAARDWHQFQILTKRSERLPESGRAARWARNIWMGVSVENQRFVHRIADLRRTHARVKFLSLEPLLGLLPDLNLSGIDWVIVGGESGPRARPMNAAWVTDDSRSDVGLQAWRSSSSSGVACSRAGTAAASKAERGMKCPISERIRRPALAPPSSRSVGQ